MKTRNFLWVAALFFSALACGLPGASPAQPTVNAALPPTPDLPFVSSPEPQNQPESTQVVADPQFSNSIKEEFDGKLSPGIGWTWLQKDDSAWSLSANPGWLRINLSTAGYLNGLPANVLTTLAPKGDFDLRTSVNFTPTQNYEFAGLIILFDKNVVLQAGRAFCNIGNCPGSGFYFDNLQNGAVVGDNFGTSESGALSTLRVVREGNVYTAYYQTDGANRTLIGSHSMSLNPVSIGLIAAQAPAAGPYAEFDYLEINQP